MTNRLLDLLDLPARTAEPRSFGVTMVIDGGLGAAVFEDQIRGAAEHVDVVKFGWGTAIVSPELERKLSVLRELGIAYYFGGTLFEKFVVQDRFDAYLRFCAELGTEMIEVSNGTIPMDNTAKAAYIRKCARDFQVVSEVGFKDSDRSLPDLAPSQWVDAIAEDLEAGSSMVITEARESGRSGICRADGELRFGLIEDILTSGIAVDSLLFEAPNKELQTHFVTRLGPNVNLGNVAPDDVIGLETLRLGLRADTLMHFEELRAESSPMRDRSDAFHLAVPCRDLDEAQRFYVNGLGCHLARRYGDRITLDFFGDQVVCHLTERWDRDVVDLYPRHFGVTFRRREDFDAVLFLAETRDLPFFATVQPRFKDRVEEHLTFVLRDPSNNLLEFKHYRDPRMMY